MIYCVFDGTKWTSNSIGPLDRSRSGGVTLAFDPGGRPAVCFYDQRLRNDGTREIEINYAISSDTDGINWNVEAVADAGFGGGGVSMAIAPNGHPSIAFHEGKLVEEFQFKFTAMFATFDGSKWTITEITPGIYQSTTNCFYPGDS